jgi:hypothetical protein
MKLEDLSKKSTSFNCGLMRMKEFVIKKYEARGTNDYDCCRSEVNLKYEFCSGVIWGLYEGGILSVDDRQNLIDELIEATGLANTI